MHRDIPPFNPNFVNVTYGADGNRIEQAPPRIARPTDVPLGSAAVKGAIPLGPGFIEAAAERGRQERADARAAPIGKYKLPEVSGDEKADALRLSVTDESRAAASDMYGTVYDDTFRQLIDDFAGSHVEASELQDLLHESDELRAVIGSYLREKLENPAFWGHKDSRVARNAWKNPDYYDAMPSRDYVVLLALAMLDGTFKPVTDKTKFVEMAPNGMYNEGEHRNTAMRLLRFASPEPQPKTKEQPE